MNQGDMKRNEGSERKMVSGLVNLFRLATDTFTYKITLIVAMFFYLFPYTVSFMSKGIKILLVWGIVVLLSNIIRDKSLFNNKRYLLLFLFFVTSGIGVLANYKENFVLNIIDYAYMIVFTFNFIYVDKIKSKKIICRELSVISLTFIFFSFLIASGSLFVFYNDIKISLLIDTSTYHIGYYENRLFGIMGNPNTGACFAWMSVTCSILMLAIFKNTMISRKRTKNTVSIFVVMNIFLQLPVCFLSSSRSVLSTIFVMMGALSILLIHKNGYWGIKTRFGRAGAVVLVTLVSICIVWVSFKGINAAMSYSSFLVSTQTSLAQSEGSVDTSQENINSQISSPPQKEHQGNTKNNNNSDLENKIILDIGREYLTEDISNGRFEIWRAGIKVFLEHPLTGVGNKNILNYVNEKISREMLMRTPLMAANMHNGYLQVLVANGGIAFLALIVFLIYVFIKCMMYFFKKEMDGNISWYSCIMFAFVLGMMVQNLFDSNLFNFINLSAVVMTWVFMGYLLNIVDNSIEKRTKDIEKNIVSNK